MFGADGQLWHRRLRRPDPSFRSREAIYPGSFGQITAGADKNYPLDKDGQVKSSPDLAMAGGFSDETHVFKALAMGAPNFKAVCMGRALMIPGMVGKNIGEWIKAGELPKTVSKHGTKVEEIFVS